MADMQNFRSALGGFNREDVVHYIEYLNRKNTNLVNQLRSENQELQAELSTLRSAAASQSEAPARIAALEEEISGLNAAAAEKDRAISDLNAQIATLTQQLQDTVPCSAEQDASQSEAPAVRIAALEEEISGLNAAAAEKDRTISDLNAQIATLTQQLQDAAPSMAQQELEAYRRAERMERVARERSQQIYRQTAAALAEATTLVDENAQQFEKIAEQINNQLQLLQSSVSDSKRALQDAASTMYAIQPESGEEA